MKYLATSNNGKRIYYNHKDGHATTHFEDTPNLYALVTSIIQTTNIVDSMLAFHTMFSYYIGYTDLVTNKPGDIIVYAKRKNRETYTSFNKSQKPIRTKRVTTIFKTYKDGYELYSAWIGRFDVPPFPGSPDEKPESKEFWGSHSLCWGTQEVLENTVTNKCPW